jgi:hypothetical protein
VCRLPSAGNAVDQLVFRLRAPDGKMLCMIRRLAPIVAGLALVITAASAAHADPQTIRMVPGSRKTRTSALSGCTPTPNWSRSCGRSKKQSQGRVSLEAIGRSNEGRDLYLAKVGRGPTTVLYVTQQHGNEPLGTEAALQLLRRLGGGGAWNSVLDRLTVLVVPRVNPDGAERFWRQNYNPTCHLRVPPLHDCAANQGYDINRWHDLAEPVNPVPEALAVQIPLRGPAIDNPDE